MAAPDFIAQNVFTETIAQPRRKRHAISREKFKEIVVLVEVAADLLTSATSIFVAYSLLSSASFLSLTEYSAQQVGALSAVFAVLVVFLQLRDGAYRSDGGLLQVRETERAIRVVTHSLVLLLIVSAVLSMRVSCLVFLIAAVVTPVFLVFQKQLLFAAVRIVRGRERGMNRVVIYGAGDSGRRAASTLLDSPRLGLRPVAVIDDRPAQIEGRMFAMGYRCRESIPIQNGPITPALLKSLRADMLLVSVVNHSSERLAAAMCAASQAGLKVTVLSGPPAEEQPCTETIEIDGLRFTSPRERPEPWHYVIAKRGLDLALSSILLVLLAPVLLLIALFIRFDSPGPALFIQKRIGRSGTLFDMYKFRSMYFSAPKYERSPRASNDRRITHFGRILRRTSLDELPQLINVLRGDMSLVGPRPEMPFIVERYNDQQRMRLQVTPGITGLWQLSADRAFPIHQNIEYDLYYIHNRNLAMDAAILIHTLFFAMSGGI